MNAKKEPCLYATVLGLRSKIVTFYITDASNITSLLSGLYSTKSFLKDFKGIYPCDFNLNANFRNRDSRVRTKGIAEFSCSFLSVGKKNNGTCNFQPLSIPILSLLRWFGVQMN
jgi:hypothetical protein